MLVSCLPWRSSVFLSLTVFLGLGQIASSTTTTTAADCTSTGSTSGYLSTSVPSCALSCVQHFISTQYTAGLCCSGNDIDCLCRTNTTSGLTLGEGALACIVGSCSSDIVSTDGSVGYAICNNVSGALPETHAAITATRVSVVTETTHLASTTVTSVSPESTGVSTAPTTVLVSSTSDKSTLITTAKTTATATATATAATTLPITTPTTFPSTTTLTGTTTTATSTASPAKSSALSSPAVIGVSIASGMSAIFLMAVAIFFCGRRLRRKRLQEAVPQSFEIGGEMSEPPDFTAAATLVPQPLPPTQPSQFPQGTKENEYSGGANFQQFPSQPVTRQQQGPLVILTRSDPANVNANPNQAAMSPETDYNGSPQSQTSQRTLSRLLPERTAIQGIVPEPLRVIRQPPTNNAIRVVGSPRPTSEATVFDEDEQQLNSNDIFGPPLDKTRRISHRNMADGGSSMRVVGLPTGPRAMISPSRTRQEQNPYDGGGSGNSGYYSYKWDKEAVPIPSATRSPSSQQYNSNGNWNNTPLQRNFSRLGSAPRSLTTPTKTNTYTPYSRNTNNFEVAPVDSSYETIMAEDDWTMTERSKLSVPSQIPRQSQHQPQQRLAPVSERIPLPSKSPVRYPAIPRSAAAAIVPATAQGMRKSHVAEVYYDNPPSLPRMPPPNINHMSMMVHELGPGHRSRSASPSPSVNSSLLAKRRGESVADKMENQFRSGVQPKPAISRKVVVARNGQPTTNTTGDEEVQSPPSAKKHNITPTRRGEDLYLRVD